jgi:hypothetical protein
MTPRVNVGRSGKVDDKWQPRALLEGESSHQSSQQPNYKSCSSFEGGIGASARAGGLVPTLGIGPDRDS